MISEVWLEALMDSKALLLDQIEEFANSIPTRERYLSKPDKKHDVIMGLLELPGERRTQRHYDPIIPQLINFIEVRYGISFDDIYLEEEVEGCVPLWKVVCCIIELRNIALEYNETFNSPYSLTSVESRRIQEILFELLHIMSGTPLVDNENTETDEQDDVYDRKEIYGGRNMVSEKDELLDADIVDQISES